MGDLEDTDITLRRDMEKEIADIHKLEASDLLQKSRVKWCVEGDENSKYFHGLINKRRRHLAIRGVFMDGEWVADPILVKNGFRDNFSSRFLDEQRSGRARPEIPNPLFGSLSADSLSFLVGPFLEEEIKMAVWACGSDKAPGPDGFLFDFFKRFWSLVKDDIIRLVHDFTRFSFFPKGCNSSFIALVPKVQNAVYIKDFRPISLIGCQYKIIGKLLASRLGVVMHEVIGHEQSAFVKGRNILDGPFIVNEVMEWYRKKEELMIFKVDLEKAYDSLRWDFLDAIMEKMGFPRRWRGWIDGCLRGARASILVNGSPTQEFVLERGLRQGDPMSPFLFILAMEGLSSMVREAVSKNIFIPAKIGPSSLPVSHLVYADDVVFLGEWSALNVQNIVRLLRCFFCVSGLKINVQKSVLYGVGTSQARINSVASLVGCSGLKPPFVYLGLMVGARMHKISSWDPVIGKFKAKLSNWKASLLSCGGRLTLIKSVLSNLPMYYMSLFKVPVGVHKVLEGLRNRFFVGAKDEGRFMTWVKWTDTIASKEKGGLGVGSIEAFNVGLLLKWVWRFLVDKNVFWSVVIRHLYGEDGGLKGTSCNYSTVWGGIVKLLREYKRKGLDCLDFFHKKVGNGKNTRFWDEPWVVDVPLKDKYPRVYALENRKDALVVARAGTDELESWLVEFRRRPRGGVEQAQMEELWSLISSFSLSPQEDRWVWKLSGDGDFSVASIRDHFDAWRGGRNGGKTRWLSILPKKVNVFMWRTSLNKLATCDNLVARGMDIPSLLCPLCGVDNESRDHLFFSCSFASELRTEFARWWGLSVLPISGFSSWIGWMDTMSLRGFKKELVQATFSIMLWSIWRFRNEFLFGRKKPRRSTVFDAIVTHSFYWCNHRSSKHCINWVRWLVEPMNSL